MFVSIIQRAWKSRVAPLAKAGALAVALSATAMFNLPPVHAEEAETLAAPEAKPAQARGPVLQCAPRSRLVATLASRHKELPKGMGLISPQRLMELYVAKSGSWTMLVTRPDGMTCIIAAGQGWVQTRAKLQGPEA